MERGDDRSREEAENLIDRLAATQAEHDSAKLRITVLRLRALLARAHADPSVPQIGRRQSVDG